MAERVASGADSSRLAVWGGADEPHPVAALSIEPNGDTGTAFRAPSVDHLLGVDDDADVPGAAGAGAGTGVEEDQVAGLLLALGNARAAVPLVEGGAGDGDAGDAVGHHGQPGAVVGVRPLSAPNVRFAELCAG